MPPSAACRVLLSLFEIQIDMNCWPCWRWIAELGLAQKAQPQSTPTQIPIPIQNLNRNGIQIPLSDQTVSIVCLYTCYT